MKKLIVLLITCVSLLVMAAGAQSVAEIAGQSRARQRANPNAKVIDNDIIPSVVDASPASSSTGASSPATPDKATQVSKDTNKEAGKPETQTDTEKQAAAEEDRKKADDLKKKIEDTKKEITQLERELKVAQREAGLRGAAYYADAGVMLRDSAKFAEDSRNLKAEIDSKAQALAAAKQRLEDLQEQARKTGIPSNQRE